MDDKIKTEHLRRKALVYVRQSTPTQVKNHQESKRLQYALVDEARALGFTSVEVIDDDLGRTGSGAVERTGFTSLLGTVCAGEIGAVLCIEDARLARNGREWHHLIDLCGLMGTLLIDPHGVYDPRLSNDRLLLGLKGSMAEFELSLIRQRSHEAIRAKAARGELRFRMPVGLCWVYGGKIEFDPDRRIQESVRLVFHKYAEIGSVNSVLRWFHQQNITMPCISHESTGTVTWRLPQYATIIGILKNPLYAGAYAFGRKETRVRVVDGRAQKTNGHVKPKDRWTVLILGHHPAYITWAEYERNQEHLTENAHMFSKESRMAGRGGHSLLVGLLRCQQCGRMLSVVYKGESNNVPRYVCNNAARNQGRERCISFGGLRPDEAVSTEVLRAVEGRAIEAALDASTLVAQEGEEQHKALSLELEQARYDVKLARRRYEAVDPENRLVAAELEARWNAMLGRVAQLEQRLAELVPIAPVAPVDRASLLALATDLPAVWNDPSADRRLKQRIVRILIQEIVVNIDEAKGEIVLNIHWSGGRHSELRITKNKTGHTGHWTAPDAVDVIRRMACYWPDKDIALALNRMRLRTGTGLTWTERRVYAIRHRLELPAYDPTKSDHTIVSLDETAQLLGVSTTVVRRLIQEEILPASQVVAGAPWQVRREDLDAPGVTQAVQATKARLGCSRTADPQDGNPMIPGL